jgi:hypothetical protein
MKTQKKFKFQSKPSLNTLQLIKERDELMANIERSHKNSVRTSKPFPAEIPRKNQKPIELSKEETIDLGLDFDSGDIRKDLKMFRSQYLSNGGTDLNVLAEISRMEKEIQQTKQPIKKDTIIKIPEEIVTAESIQQKVQNMRLKHEEDMMTFDFKRERLIAQHELYELEVSIREAESNKIQPTKKKIDGVVLNNLPPVVYDSQYGFYIKWYKSKLTIGITLLAFYQCRTQN